MISKMSKRVRIIASSTAAGTLGLAALMSNSGKGGNVVEIPFTLDEWDTTFKTKDKADEFIHDEEGSYIKVEIPGQPFFYVTSNGNVDGLVHSGKKDSYEQSSKTAEELKDKFFYDLNRDSEAKRSNSPLKINHSEHSNSYWTPKDYSDGIGKDVWHDSAGKVEELYAGTTLAQYFHGYDVFDTTKTKAHTSLNSAFNSIVEASGVQYTFNGITFNSIPEAYTYFLNNFVSLTDQVYKAQTTPYVASNGSNVISSKNYNSIQEAISGVTASSREYERTLISDYLWNTNDWEDTLDYRQNRDKWIVDNTLETSTENWLTWAKSTNLVDFMKSKRNFEGISDQSWYHRYVWNDNFNENALWTGFRASIHLGRKLFESEFTTGDNNAINALQEWDVTKDYWEEDYVLYNGYKWKARWWTIGDEPGTTLSWTNMGVYPDPDEEISTEVDPTKSFTCEGETLVGETEFISDFKRFWNEFNLYQIADFDTFVKAKLCEGGKPLYAEKRETSTNGRGWLEDFWSAEWFVSKLDKIIAPTYLPDEDDYRISVEYTSSFNGWKAEQDKLGYKWWYHKRYNSTSLAYDAINTRITTNITGDLFESINFKKGEYTYPGETILHEVINSTELKVLEIIESNFYNDVKYETTSGGTYSLKAGLDFNKIGINVAGAPVNSDYWSMKLFLHNLIDTKYGIPGQSSTNFNEIKEFNNDVNSKIIGYPNFNNSNQDIFHKANKSSEIFNNYIWSNMNTFNFLINTDMTESVTKIVLSIDKNQKQFDTIEEAVEYWESKLK